METAFAQAKLRENEIGLANSDSPSALAKKQHDFFEPTSPAS